MILTVEVTADIPKALLREFLQQIRDFDSAHSNEVYCKFSVIAPDLTPGEVQNILNRIKPPIELTLVRSRKRRQYPEG